MQTIYYSTSNFIRHEGNVVDLTEYRRKLAVAEGSLAPAPQSDFDFDFADDRQDDWEQAPALRLLPKVEPVKLSAAAKLELCASFAIIVMTLAFAVKVFML